VVDGNEKKRERKGYVRAEAAITKQWGKVPTLVLLLSQDIGKKKGEIHGQEKGGGGRYPAPPLILAKKKKERGLSGNSIKIGKRPSPRLFGRFEKAQGLLKKQWKEERKERSGSPANSKKGLSSIPRGAYVKFREAPRCPLVNTSRGRRSPVDDERRSPSNSGKQHSHFGV